MYTYFYVLCHGKHLAFCAYVHLSLCHKRFLRERERERVTRIRMSQRLFSPSEETVCAHLSLGAGFTVHLKSCNDFV